MNPQHPPIASVVTTETASMASPAAPTQNGTTTPRSSVATRMQVAKKYCRVLTAIDDEIFQKVTYQPDREGLLISSRFNELLQSCEEGGMFCHLLHFPQSDHSTDRLNEETRKYLRRAVNSAKNADVVVLDWHLAHPSDPTNALYILDQLTQGEPRIQFVMIYTEQENLRDVANQIEADFGTRDITLKSLYPAAAPDLSGGDELVSGASDSSEPERFGFHLNQRLFVFLAAKSDVHADSVLEFVYDALVRFLPDRLQWAGLELMGRTRDILPKVVAALPTGTNPALQGQLLFQREDEVAFQVADSLLDELRHVLLEQPLEVVNDAELFGDLRSNMTGLYSDFDKWKLVVDVVQPNWADNLKKARDKGGEGISGNDKAHLEKFQMCQNQWQTPNLKAMREDVAKGLEDRSYIALEHFFPRKKLPLALSIGHYLVGEAEEAKVMRSHVAWAQVRESVLLTEGINMRPGAVLQKIEEGSHPDAPEWLFCQTGACDCYRPHGHGFLFIVGRTQAGATSKQAETQACVLGREIVWNAPQMLVLPNPTESPVSIPGLHDNKIVDAETGESKEPEKTARYRIVGAMRTEFTARIIQRVFNHQGRIGVDTCELVRFKRSE